MRKKKSRADVRKEREEMKRLIILMTGDLQAVAHALGISATAVVRRVRVLKLQDEILPYLGSFDFEQFSELHEGFMPDLTPIWRRGCE